MGLLTFSERHLVRMLKLQFMQPPHKKNILLFKLRKEKIDWYIYIGNQSKNTVCTLDKKKENITDFLIFVILGVYLLRYGLKARY